MITLLSHHKQVLQTIGIRVVFRIKTVRVLCSAQRTLLLLYMYSFYYLLPFSIHAYGKQIYPTRRLNLKIKVNEYLRTVFKSVLELDSFLGRHFCCSRSLVLYVYASFRSRHTPKNDDHVRPLTHLLTQHKCSNPTHATPRRLCPAVLSVKKELSILYTADPNLRCSAFS